MGRPKDKEGSFDFYYEILLIFERRNGTTEEGLSNYESGEHKAKPLTSCDSSKSKRVLRLGFETNVRYDCEAACAER